MQIEIFPGSTYGWFWHFRNKGRVTADAQTFPSKAHAMRAAKAVVKATIKEVASREIAFHLAPNHKSMPDTTLTLKWTEYP